MDRKVKRLILAFMALTIFVSCEPDDVDGPPPGDWYYQFVNGTSHDVKKYVATVHWKRELN
jgi:hypothetical protein